MSVVFENLCYVHLYRIPLHSTPVYDLSNRKAQIDVLSSITLPLYLS